MRIKETLHLSYCTNIHPGETWQEVFQNLSEYLPEIKKQISPDQPFGIGLRLSDLASRELAGKKALQVFQGWLEKHNLYVYTMNGFPFGGFHHQAVKDNVHQPDWTTMARLAYTKRLAHILAALLPEGMEGGISTSPLSYKPWHDTQEGIQEVFASATQHMVEMVDELWHIQATTGKVIHIDIEPEPDGLLENSDEIIGFFHDWLLPLGIETLNRTRGLTEQQAKEAVLRHLQICYDVCHFALAYEQPEEAFAKLAAAEIRVGKIQLSAALKAKIPSDSAGKEALLARLSPFAESTYLHQVVAQGASGSLTHYPDLGPALDALQESKAREWRIHFHVPLFTKAYNGLQSTQDDIERVLAYINNQPVTNHLEVETYTWEVLPEGLKVDLSQSIQRELEWVLETVNAN